MSLKKKHIRKVSQKKKMALKLPKPYPFESSIIESGETLFPEKVARANEILRNCKFMDSFEK
jgi:hypothetical protein